MTRHIKPALALAVGAVLLASGCGSSDNTPAASSAPATSAPATSTSETTAPESSAPAAPTTQSETQSSNGLDGKQAIEAAQGIEPDGFVVELDYEDDQNAWEVKVASESGEDVELLVDASSGEEIGRTPKNLDAEQQKNPATSATDAYDAALEAQPGTLTSLELDMQDNNQLAWEAEIQADDFTEWNVYVDPDSGEVLNTVQDN